MIKNIVFDMGAVIIDFDPKRILGSLFEKEDAEKVEEVLFHTDAWDRRDRGTATNEEVLKEALPLLPERTHEKVRKMVDNFFVYMPEFEDVYEIIKEIKAQGFKLYLLSNCSPDFYEHTDYIKSFKYFDGLMVSADCRLMKPEKEIYEYFLNKFSLKAEECFFFDDRRENIEGAKMAGINGKVFSHKDMPGFIQKLGEIGVNIGSFSPAALKDNGASIDHCSTAVFRESGASIGHCSPASFSESGASIDPRSVSDPEKAE